MSERHRILVMYLLLLSSIVLISILTPLCQLIAAIGIYGTLFASYILRKMHHIDDIVTNHAIYISRTIWIWTLFLFLGVLGAVITILFNMDTTEIHSLMDQINAGQGGMDEAALDSSMQKFSQANEKLVMTALILWLLPIQAYALWRVHKGISRAMGGYRIQNPTKWF
ncbi:MAG: hypothetical protein JNK24_01420 [Alphaproteobacteria bacterium]|nr:hypothetical protein [Alphaproteobacteria bacterium]